MRNYDNYAKQICRNFIKSRTYPLVAIYSKGMTWIKGVIDQNFYENQILVSIWRPSFIFNTNIMGYMHIRMFRFFVPRAYVIISSWYFFSTSVNHIKIRSCEVPIILLDSLIIYLRRDYRYSLPYQPHLCPPGHNMQPWLQTVKFHKNSICSWFFWYFKSDSQNPFWVSLLNLES